VHTNRFSNFRLETYGQCREKYYNVYFANNRKKDFNRPYLIEGQFCHDVLRQYRAQIQHMEDDDFKTRFEVMADSYRLFLKLHDTTQFDPRRCRAYLYDYLREYKDEPIRNSVELEERF